VTDADDSSDSPAWSPERYATNARFVAELGRPVLALLAPRSGESILDLGCGDGVLTVELAAHGASVIAVDSSPEMVAAARARGLDARVIDAHELSFSECFDAVFSNAALHWMRDPDRVVSAVARALKPGGRFIGECGAHGNVATLVRALEAGLERRGIDGRSANPWHFASGDEHRARLERCGFEVRQIDTFRRPTRLPGDIVGWLETFAASFTRLLPADQRSSYIREVADECRPALADEHGECCADYVRLRFAAVKR
jgi:SAM-dependent methyltransferase